MLGANRSTPIAFRSRSYHHAHNCKHAFYPLRKTTRRTVLGCCTASAAYCNRRSATVLISVDAAARLASAVARTAIHTDTLPTMPPQKGEVQHSGHIGTTEVPPLPVQARAEAAPVQEVHEDTESKKVAKVITCSLGRLKHSCAKAA